MELKVNVLFQRMWWKFCLLGELFLPLPRVQKRCWGERIPSCPVRLGWETLQCMQGEASECRGHWDIWVWARLSGVRVAVFWWPQGCCGDRQKCYLGSEPFSRSAACHSLSALGTEGLLQTAQAMARDRDICHGTAVNCGLFYSVSNMSPELLLFII